MQIREYRRRRNRASAIGGRVYERSAAHIYVAGEKDRWRDRQTDRLCSRGARRSRVARGIYTCGYVRVITRVVVANVCWFESISAFEVHTLQVYVSE